jgi:hypothetical protein
VRVYEVAVVMGPTVAVPELTWLPDQPPEAVHAVALVEDQVSGWLSVAEVSTLWKERD